MKTIKTTQPSPSNQKRDVENSLPDDRLKGTKTFRSLLRNILE